MKRSILALALCLVLPLSGCTSLSGSMYTVVEPHVEQPVLGEDSSTIKAGTYSELVNGVLFFVSQGIEEGTIQLTDYTGDVEEDLNRACLEVATDDPLGAYAVDFIKNEYTTIITTYEATITIAYRRSQEQMNSLINITGTSAIETEVAQALAAFQTELAMRVGYFTGDEDTVLGQLRRAYYEDPAAALGMPQCTVNLYPDSGTQRIVELLLTYPQEPAVLQRRSQQLREKADELVEPVGQQIDSRQLSLLLELLPGAVKVDPQGGVTAWDALLGEGANHEGLALAFQLLCNTLELDCALVEGTLEGETHFWNQVTYSGAARFVDLSRSLTQLWTPAQLTEMGYQWEEQETG